jgi:cold shock CspA family protein
MNTNTKERGVIIHWNEARQFGFVAQRLPNGQRQTYFLHSDHIEKIDREGGIPQLNDTVLFFVRWNPKGPVATNAEVYARDVAFDKLAGGR